MSDGGKASVGFLEAADRLEVWAAQVPRWDPSGSEPWYEFLDRQYEAEMKLATRLRMAPSCRLEMCPTRNNVKLSLGGIRVTSSDSLASACRAWAHEVRAQLERATREPAVQSETAREPEQVA